MVLKSRTSGKYLQIKDDDDNTVEGCGGSKKNSTYVLATVA